MTPKCLRLLVPLIMMHVTKALYYDGLTTYSIYPRLDLQICANSSLSFDFSLSVSHFKNSSQSPSQYSARVLLYSEQQIQISTVSTNSQKLINSYFLIKYQAPNRLIINDYWNINEVQIQLPSDYATSWFKFVYTRTSGRVDINLYKFESTDNSANNRIPSIRLISLFAKQIIHSNFVLDELNGEDNGLLVDSKQVTYSKLFVGGVGDNPGENNYALNQLKQLAKFHGYIMNLQYTSQTSQCASELCSKQSIAQRHYAIFSLSPSKQLKSNILSDSLIIDDICESDFLSHDICPKDCSCLSNNLIAPFFNCECAESTVPKSKCHNLKKSLTILFNDENYFSAQSFEYAILPSFTKIQVNNQATDFDKSRGVQFKSPLSRLTLSPSDAQASQWDSCLWNIEDCVHGFSQHLVMSMDRLDDTKYNSKIVLFQNGQSDMAKLVCFVYKNLVHFSLFEPQLGQEWIVSSFGLERIKHLSRELRVSVTWLRDKYMSLHVDGHLVDMTTKPSSPPVNQDVYVSLNGLAKFYYEFGVRDTTDLLKNSAYTLHSHQFTVKWIRRDYLNEADAFDSKILVSSPLPSEIIRIDNSQRVMYKIDSPLTSVSSETIELSFRTSQPDGVVFYIRNQPLITYFELVRGQPVIVVDTRVKNLYLRPESVPLNDNQWHEIKLHRDGQLISVNIDSQYHDMCEMIQVNNQILTGGYVYLGLADPNNINLSDKRTFVGEMVRGKVTINNVQQKVVQQPYYWPSVHTTNQTLNIDTSQISQDGKMINIVINVYGPPGLMLEFYTQPGQIKFTKITIGGADDWSRIKFFGTKSDFVGCIIDLFQVNGNSVIKPADIEQERYNCNVERPVKSKTRRPAPEWPACLADRYPVNFGSVQDAIETIVCEHIQIPFRTTRSKGIIYSHASSDAANYILVYLRNGLVNVIVRDMGGERNVELTQTRVDDGISHNIDIECHSAGYLIAYLDQSRHSASRIELYSSIKLDTYTLGYYSTQVMSSRYATYEHFSGCLDQVYVNRKCMIFEMNFDASRYRCGVQATTTTSPAPSSTAVKRPTCINQCQGSKECVIETSGRGFVIFNGYEAGARASHHDLIRFSFKVTGEKSQAQDLLSVYDGEKSLRVYLSAGGELMFSLGEQQVATRIGKHSALNDGMWHKIVIEKQAKMVIFSVDGVQTVERVAFEFDLFGTGSLYFGASHRQQATNLHGYLRDVFVKFSAVEYDVLAAAIDIRLPGVACHGHVILKNLVEKSSSMLWRFRGSNSGQISFVPHLPQSRESNLNLQFNTSQPHGVIMCTRDDNYALKVELNNQMLMISITDLRSRQIVKSAYCQKRSLSDNKWHKVHLAKKSNTQLVFSCDDSTQSTLQSEIDIPFVNSNKGVVFATDCAGSSGTQFIGELSEIAYSHNSKTYSFNDLQYTEDPRFTYDNYVEFSPKVTSEIHSDPKPIFFRSGQSSAQLERWDDSKLGRISFEFRTEMAKENGIIFSTDLANNLFAISIKDGYLEAILSPHRVPYADSSSQISSYDRYQRLFPSQNVRINDGRWHKLEFLMIGDLIASLVLDDDHSSKIRFPHMYWTEESSLIFGHNSEFRKFELPSFRGCLRNVVVNNRLVNWLSTGSLDNIEVGCHGNRYEILNLHQQPEESSLNLDSDGCVRYAPRTSSNQESIEFFFKTGGDQHVILDSQSADFVIHTQGPSVVIRSRDDSSMAVVAERGIYFNDLNWHKIRLDKQENKITLELDSKYKQEFVLSKRSSYLAPFLFGCSKSSNLRFNKLKNFAGAFKQIEHVSQSRRVDLVERLNAGDADLQVDGQVFWVNSPGGHYENTANSVTLKDSSFIQLDNLIFDKNSNISFMFKTNEENGLLALIDSGNKLDHISVELSSGLVNFLVDAGQKSHRALCASKANDKKWHHVSIKRDGFYSGSSLTFTCDNTVHRIQINDRFPTTVQFRSGNLSSDSVPANLWANKFSGCVQDLRINEQEINIYEKTSSDSRKTLDNKCSEATGLCQKGICSNYAECVEGFTEWTCKCETTSYTGHRCDQAASTLSFNGSHTVEFVLKEAAKSSSEQISLRFRTGLRNGVLFSLKKSQNEPSMVLSVEDGRLKCVYDRQNNDKVIYAGDVDSFNNNKWHTVHLVRTGATIHLQLTDNQGQKHVANDNLGEDFDLIAYSHVIIGGARSPSLVQEHSNFIGWIQNLNFNGQHLFHNYLNSHLPSWSHSVDGYADPGENSILLHHQITLTAECVITLPRAQSTNKLTIHLFFKTTEENGVILFRRGKQFRFMALEMRDGRLRFVFDLGAGLKQILSPHTLNDKNWHEVTIHRFDRQKLALKIDDHRELFADMGTNSPGLSELESFTIGGLVPGHQKFEPHVLTTKGFTGCLASVELNGDAADLYSNRLNMCPSVQQGCVDLACSSDTCSNNGQCSVLNGQVTCNCDMTSYTGDHCRDNSDYYFFGKTSQQCGLIKHALVPALANQHSDQLAFGFTTLDTDALLVRVQGLSQYMDIRLSGGYLTIVVNLNNLEERFVYSTLEDKKFNDNTYHVVQFVRQKNLITFQVDNFEQIRYTLQSNDNCVFQSQQFVYIGSIDKTGPKNADCFYGIITGVFFNQIHVLNEASEQYGDVGIVDYRYIVIDIDVNRNRTRPLLADMSCPLGYTKQIDVCIFSICPLNSDQIADSCSCYQGYHQMGNGCIKRNETSPAGVVGSSAKLIPAKTASWETPIGLILGIISGIALALLAAGIGARKCSDGLCVPAARAKAAKATTTAGKVASMFSSTTNTTNQSYEMNTAGREQVPLIHNNAEAKFSKQEEYMAKDTLDMGYNYFPQPVVTQSVNETMEMYEQTMAGGGGATTTVTTYGLPTIAYSSNHGAHHASQHASHHASQRDIAMSSMFFAHNNSEYELSNVNCVTMTPNGKYAIIGQSSGAPQIWDTLSGQLVRTMAGPCSNCSCLSLACNGSLLVGLSNEGPAIDSPIQSVQIWEVQTGKPVQMSHQIKCCVFQLSQDTNSIYMAGNQRFGRGISVGILDLVTFELTKEVKSDPTLSLGDNPESVVITPDERHAIVGCRYASGTNFVVFDLTKASEIGQTRSIAFDADPKCIAVLNNGEVITGTRGGHLIQWNIHTCQITTTYVDQSESTAHLGPINQVGISGDKEHLVSGSSDGTVKVWNTVNKSLVSVLNGHRGEVTCVSISNNDLIVSGSTDQTVALWRLFGANQISSMPVGMNLVEVNMAKHNKTIVAIGEKDGEQQLLMLRVVNVQR